MQTVRIHRLRNPAMQHHSVAPSASFHGLPPSSSGSRIEDQQFAVMQTTFAESGGLLGVNEVARLLRHRTQQPISEVARGQVA